MIKTKFLQCITYVIRIIRDVHVFQIFGRENCKSKQFFFVKLYYNTILKSSFKYYQQKLTIREKDGK